MSVSSGPEIVNDGMVFSYDMGNTQRSWKGRPAVNLFTNGHFSNGTGIPQQADSTPTNSIIYFPNNPGETSYVLQQNGSYTEYQINLTTELLASTTYCLSGWYANSLDYNGTETMFHCRAISTSGANVSLGVEIGTVIQTRVIDGITWKYCYATITMPADYSNIFSWFIGYGAVNTTGYRYYTNIQMELGTYPSKFVNGTRSNTQAIIDLTGNRTVTATSLTYANDNTFSFNGSTNYITTTNTGITHGTANFSYSCWAKWSGKPSLGTLFENGNWTSSILFRFETNGITIFSMGTGYGKFTFDPTLNIWYHLTFVRNANNIELYVNGVFLSSLAFGTSVNIIPNTSLIFIGMSQHSAGQCFNGQISNVSIYNRALTTSEVQQNFNALRGRFGI